MKTWESARIAIKENLKFEKESRMEDKGNVIKLPPFDGKKKKFPLFWSKFEAACNVKGCAEALEDNFESVLPKK